MTKVFLAFLGLIITSPINAQSKAEIFAKENTEKLSEILEFTRAEYTQVYDILVEKETEFNVLRKKYKNYKDTLNTKIQRLNPIYNRRLKDILGQDKMIKYHDYFKAENKILLVDIGHYESEQYTKNILFDILRKKFPNFAIALANTNTNPVNYT